MNVANAFGTGVVTISLDTELGWGNIHSEDYSHVEQRLEEGQKAIERLHRTFDEYRIPVTWAIVGQLCHRRDDSGPPPGSEVVVQDKSVPWHRDWWHGPELIDAIAGSPVDHEIASHSANHLVYTEASPETVAEDLELFRSLAADYEPIRSFVYPQNEVAHRSILAEHGFDCYRGRPPILGSDPFPTVFRPRREDGLVNVPASTALRHYNGRSAPLKHFPTGLKGWLLKRGVDRASRRGSVFHVVLHPNDFTLSDGRRLLEILDEFLAYVAAKRESGEIRTRTMGDVATDATFE